MNKLEEANIDNLTRLWRSMDTLRLPEGMLQSNRWPNKLWYAPEHAPSAANLQPVLQTAPARVTLPIWVDDAPYADALHTAGFTLASRHTAMALEPGRLAHPARRALTDYSLIQAASECDLETWTQVGSAAFGYHIDHQSTLALAAADGVALYLAYLEEHCAGTALLFDSDGVVGIHQVGTVPAFRGRGLARQLMYDLVAVAGAGRYHVLQASAAGQPLYEQMGFDALFTIHNYHRRNAEEPDNEHP